MLFYAQHKAIFSDVGMAELGVQHHQFLPCDRKTYSISLGVGNDRGPGDWLSWASYADGFPCQSAGAGHPSLVPSGLERAVPQRVGLVDWLHRMRVSADKPEFTAFHCNERP